MSLLSAARVRFWIAIGITFLVLAGPGALSAADPFYVTMLEDGREALEQGDREAALKKLEIACFGFLEEPPLLAEGLVFLLMTHDGLGDLAEVRRVFGRLDEIEESFQAVSEAELDEETRKRFEETIGRRISERTLASSSFRSLLVAKLEAEIATLPPRKQRAELEARAVEEPDDPKWPIRLAALELQQDHSSEALAWADKAVALGQQLPCLRGVALADLKRDVEALVELESCPEIGVRLDWTAAALRAHVRLDQWDEAAALLERSDAAVVEDRDIERIARRVRRKAGSGDEDVETMVENEAAPVADEPPTAAEGDLPPGRTPPLSADEQADLQEARSLLRTARRVEELRVAALLADPVAERHSDSQEAQLIAGEIAYRAARWQDASRYFRLAGDPGDSRPALLFYMAVSFYESGQRALARQALGRCLADLHRTPYVDSYVEKIQATD